MRLPPTGLYTLSWTHGLTPMLLFLIHLADTTSHTAVVGKGVLQNKTSHAGSSTIHQIFVNFFEAFFAVIVICINDNKWCIQKLLLSQYRLSSSPWLGTAFRKSSRNIMYVLEHIGNTHTVLCAN